MYVHYHPSRRTEIHVPGIDEPYIYAMIEDGDPETALRCLPDASVSKTVRSRLAQRAKAALRRPGPVGGASADVEYLVASCGD